MAFEVETLISEPQIQERVRELGRQIEADYQGKPLTIVAVLTGSLILLADLIRQIQLPLRVALLQASSYKGATTTAATLVINESFAPDVAGRDVLLLDDILDTGHTLAALVRHMADRGARSVRTAVLLRKIGRQEVPLEPDYCGFTIPDAFVVGYGLDYNDDYRHLPYVAVPRDGKRLVPSTQQALVTPPLKLALVTRRYPPLIGGAEKVLSYLAEALAAEGAEVTVLTSQAAGTEGLPAARRSYPSDRPGAGPADGSPPGDLAAAVRRDLALHAEPAVRWLRDTSGRPGLCVDAQARRLRRRRRGQRKGFPVVLRPEGAGATGDLAWQGWGRFGRRSAGAAGRPTPSWRSRSEISRELDAAGYDPARIHALPNGVPVPESPWQRRPDWRSRPARDLRRPARAREGPRP